MRAIIFLIVLTLFAVQVTYSQRYITRNGTIRFYSEAPLENIEAVNRQVNTAYDSQTGEFVFRVLIRAFQFDKALMQEHFNESYMESHKFPNATFSGVVENHGLVRPGRDGTHAVKVSGELTIKGVTKEVQAEGTMTVSGDNILTESTFTIQLADYGISIPAPVVRNIAREIEITVSATLSKLQ